MMHKQVIANTVFLCALGASANATEVTASNASLLKKVDTLENEIKELRAQVPSSADELDSDLIKLPYDLNINAYESIQDENPMTICIPAKVKFRFSKESELWTTVHRTIGFGEGRSSDDDITYDKCLENPENTLKPGIRKFISNAELNSAQISHTIRTGVKYGLLVAPYKYYTSDGDLKPAATIAPYAGWRLDSNAVGVGFSGILFAGPAMIPVSAEDGGTSNLFAVSGGGGVLVELNKQFNIGALIGFDVVSQSDKSKFDNHGKPWLSISFGYNFGG